MYLDSPLALQLDLPFVLVRKAGKLPPPIVSATKNSSYFSSAGAGGPREEVIEMAKDAISKDESVVLVDDVLATGKTLCAMLDLPFKAGADTENISVAVVTEFPLYRGRNWWNQSGFGGVKIQSLLLFDGM